MHATSDWITTKISNILSEIVGVNNYVIHRWMMGGFLLLATLRFEKKLQNCIRMGISIFQFSLGEVYRRICGRKSRFTSPLARHHKAKLQTVFPTIYLPKLNFSIQLSPNNFDKKKMLYVISLLFIP